MLSGLGLEWAGLDQIVPKSESESLLVAHDDPGVSARRDVSKATATATAGGNVHWQHDGLRVRVGLRVRRVGAPGRACQPEVYWASSSLYARTEASLVAAANVHQAHWQPEFRVRDGCHWQSLRWTRNSESESGSQAGARLTASWDSLSGRRTRLWWPLLVASESDVRQIGGAGIASLQGVRAAAWGSPCGIRNTQQLEDSSTRTEGARPARHRDWHHQADPGPSGRVSAGPWL